MHENHGNPQDSREFCGNHRNPWNPIELDGTRESFEFHRVVGIIWVALWYDFGNISVSSGYEFGIISVCSGY